MAEQLARVSDAFQERYTIERELGRGGWAMDLGAEGFLRGIAIASRLIYSHISSIMTSMTPAADSSTLCRLWRRSRCASGPSASRSLPLDETVGRAVERETIPPGAG
jgi:hypothetical protein